MKKFTVAVITLIMAFSLFACAKSENRANVSLKEGETKITGTVEQVSGNTVVLQDSKGGRYSFTYSDEIDVVEGGYYVVDLAAASFKGERISVICSEQIMETYPAMLSDVRIIIIK